MTQTDSALSDVATAEARLRQLGVRPAQIAKHIAGLRAVQRRRAERAKQSGNDDEARLEPVRRFIANCCLTGPHQRVDADELHRAYLRWANANGEDELGSLALATRLGQIEPAIVKVGSERVGISVRRP